MKTTLTGHAAIAYAQVYGLPLSKYADPTKGPGYGLTPEEALEVAAQDPGLIYVDVADTDWARSSASYTMTRCDLELP